MEVVCEHGTWERLRRWHAPQSASYPDLHLWVMDVQVTLSFDETTTIGDVNTLFKVFAGGKNVSVF